MSALYLMISITARDNLPDFLSLYNKNGVEVNNIALGRGTAPESIAEMFGLTKSENAVCFSVVTPKVWQGIKFQLYNRMEIDAPGTGIVLCIPLSSIGGQRELNYLTDGQNYVKGDESVLKNTDRELLLVICNQGYNTIVMDAARGAGARGGTVIHAVGTGIKKSEQFLGVSLATEKDMIYIVVNQDQKKPVMEAIMKKAGLGTKAKSVCFSMPIADSAGLKHLGEDKKKNEEAAAAQSGQ